MIANILKESLALLKKQPKAFVPKLITTFLYSIQAIWLASLSLKLINIETPEAMPTEILQESLMLFAFMIVLYFIDIGSYAMYPTIVADYHKKKPVSLSASLWNAVKSWKTIIFTGILILIFMTMVSFIAAMIQIFVMQNIPALTWITAPIILLVILVFSILMFFLMPIAVLEKKGIAASMGESMALGFKHRKELIKINVILLVLALITMLTGMAYKMQGLAAAITIAGFIIVRLLQAIVYTYMCVVNPYFYLKVKESG